MAAESCAPPVELDPVHTFRVPLLDKVCVPRWIAGAHPPRLYGIVGVRYLTVYETGPRLKRDQPFQVLETGLLHNLKLMRQKLHDAAHIADEFCWVPCSVWTPAPKEDWRQDDAEVYQALGFTPIKCKQEANVKHSKYCLVIAETFAHDGNSSSKLLTSRVQLVSWSSVELSDLDCRLAILVGLRYVRQTLPDGLRHVCVEGGSPSRPSPGFPQSLP